MSRTRTLAPPTQVAAPQPATANVKKWSSLAPANAGHDLAAISIFPNGSGRRPPLIRQRPAGPILQRQDDDSPQSLDVLAFDLPLEKGDRVAIPESIRRAAAEVEALRRQRAETMSAEERQHRVPEGIQAIGEDVGGSIARRGDAFAILLAEKFDIDQVILYALGQDPSLPESGDAPASQLNDPVLGILHAHPVRERGLSPAHDVPGAIGLARQHGRSFVGVVTRRPRQNLEIRILMGRTLAGGDVRLAELVGDTASGSLKVRAVTIVEAGT